MSGAVISAKSEQLPELKTAAEERSPAQEFSRHLRAFRGDLFTERYVAPQISGAMPRLIAVDYAPAALIRAHNLISALPPNSTVGLPLDSGSRGVIERKGFSNGSEEETFTALAKHAASIGHRVVLLERPTARLVDRERAIERERHEILNRYKNGDKLSGSEMVKLINARDGMMPWHGELMRLECKLAVWRASMVARALLRKTDWRESDLVVLGPDQADDVAAMLGWRVTERFSERSSAEVAHAVEHDHGEYRRLMAARERKRGWVQFWSGVRGWLARGAS